MPPALLSAILTWAVRPLTTRIALWQSRTHVPRTGFPTPQGGGVAVIAATLVSPVAIVELASAAGTTIPFAVFSATLFIAAVGFADDVKSIPIEPRLLLQGLAVAAVVLAAPESLRIVPAFPLWLERGLLVLI